MPECISELTLKRIAKLDNQILKCANMENKSNATLSTLAVLIAQNNAILLTILRELTDIREFTEFEKQEQ